MSNNGVLLRASIPDMYKVLPTIFKSLTTLIPIGLGLFGLRLANIPIDLFFAQGGEIVY